MNAEMLQLVQTSEQQIARQQRLALLGQLAATIQHEANNALMTIMDRSQARAHIRITVEDGETPT